MQAEVDVLLADIAMPGQDGYALIRTVRSALAPRVASIPAAAVTAFTLEEHRQRALAAGFHLHLGKPVEAGKLARAVRMLANRSTQ
jgi:CheY-like chemotaxis protein